MGDAEEIHQLVEQLNEQQAAAGRETTVTEED